MSLVHVDTPNTPKRPFNVDKEEQEAEEPNKDNSVDISTKGQEGPKESRTHIEVNNEENKIEPSVVVVSSTDAKT